MAADLDMSARANLPFQVIAVTTSAVKKVLLARRRKYVLRHSGIQDDASTAGVAGDYVVLMQQADSMVASMAAGRKVPIRMSGPDVIIDGGDAAPGSDGAHEIQLKAVTHGAMIEIFSWPK